MTPATARRTRARHARQPPPRRVSGPVRRPIRALPGGATRQSVPDHRLVDRLLHSRAWIWVIGALLGGIVAMQVSLLNLNSGISRAVETSTTLERQNADLELAIARLASSDSVRAEAQRKGMVVPPAGDVEFLSSRPGGDADRAAARMRAPSYAARALMANRGVVPGSLATPATPTQSPPAAQSQATGVAVAGQG